jgi:hypothetical protein
MLLAHGEVWRWSDPLMRTTMEYRLEAKACLELARQTNEVYVKTALVELARDYNRAAHRAELRERDTAFAVELPRRRSATSH